MADDRLSAELAAIKERREVAITAVASGMIGPVDPVQQIHALAQLADVDVPRLVKAVEKLLAAADRWQLHPAGDDAAADDYARDVREVIARELTGKAADRG